MRLAVIEDLPLFERELREYLKEQTAMRFSKRTLDRYRDLGRAYLEGKLAGVIVLGGLGGLDRCFVLAGEDWGISPVDNELGRVATVWIAWVPGGLRQQGVALEMLCWGRQYLLEQGFETAVMGVLEDNKEGRALTEAYGARLKERLYSIPLKEDPDGRRRID